MKVLRPLLFVPLLLGSALSVAHEYEAGTLHIEHPWSRELPAVAPTIPAYFVIQNHGEDSDTLLSVDTPIAGKAELHESVQSGDSMQMRGVDTVDIPAGGEVKFQPMGYHVMLMDLKQHPRDGQRFPLVLHFRKAGEVKVEVEVQKEAPGAEMKSMDHGKMDHHQHVQ